MPRGIGNRAPELRLEPASQPVDGRLDRAFARTKRLCDSGVAAGGRLAYQTRLQRIEFGRPP